MTLMKLLNSTSYRRLQLIERLTADDAWITLDTLSDQLCCSRRTLVADIQMINNSSKAYFHIETSKQRGVKLIASDLFHMEEVYQDLMQESLNSQIIKEVIELDVVTKEKLAEKLFISSSSLSRNLKQIALLLEEYELSIQMNPIKIIGKEKQIRYFYSVFLCELYSADIERFHHPLKKVALTFLQQLEEKNESRPYSFITHYRIIIWLTVCADRITKGHLIEDVYILPQPLSREKEELLKKLVKQLPFETTKKELAFLMYIYSNNHREFNSKDLADNASLNTVYQEIISFVEKVKKETGYILEDQSALVDNLMGYCFYRDFFKGPTNLLFSPKRRLFGPSLKLFNEFITITSRIAKQYPDSVWNQNDRVEEFTFMLLLCWRGLASQVISKKDKISLLIVSYVCVQQELFLCDMLKAKYPTTIECYAISQIESLKKDYQLVLTDYSERWIEEKRVPSEKVIGISMIPTKRDWKRIEATIKLFE